MKVLMALPTNSILEELDWISNSGALSTEGAKILMAVSPGSGAKRARILREIDPEELSCMVGRLPCADAAAAVALPSTAAAVQRKDRLEAIITHFAEWVAHYDHLGMVGFRMLRGRYFYQSGTRLHGLPLACAGSNCSPTRSAAGQGRSRNRAIGRSLRFLFPARSSLRRAAPARIRATVLKSASVAGSGTGAAVGDATSSWKPDQSIS